MPAITTPVLPQGEVAYILRRNLGPQRTWADFLADCIRDKTSFFGLVLLPTATVRFRGSKRPVYAVRDVHEFVRDAIAKAPPTTSAAAYLTHAVELDPADRRHWKTKLLVLH